MESKKRIRLPRVGLRVIKTILSVTVIYLLYDAFGRNACFACIGAVFGMGNALSEGRRSGGNRFIGTFVGGLIAIPFYPLYHTPPFGIPAWFYLTLGLFCVLYISQLLGVNGSIQPGTVVFYVVILTVSQSRFLGYTLNRIIDTGIGVAVSLLISRLWPSKLDKQARLEAQIAAERALLAEYQQELEEMLQKQDEAENG